MKKGKQTKKNAPKKKKQIVEEEEEEEEEIVENENEEIDEDLEIDQKEDKLEEEGMDISPEKNPSKKNRGRLMIEKISMTNFKSYAGTKEIGPFHHNFSAIVGPNG
jgi:structural maintenance of chromosome 4